LVVEDILIEGNNTFTLADSQNNSMANTYCCVYSVETPDDEQ
jgi:hypothetical protein